MPRIEKTIALLLAVACYQQSTLAVPDRHRVAKTPRKQSKHSKQRQLKGKDNNNSNRGTTILDVLAVPPPLPGVAAGVDRPKVLLAADIDYPPYALLGTAADGFPLSGFGADLAKHLPEVCNIDVYVQQTQWAKCWGDNIIGGGVAAGEYHGCMTYTHTAGVRNRYLEFSTPILDDVQPAGILTRLDASGNPVVDGVSNLNGVKVVDVVGWAPTADTLAIVSNQCTGEKFTGYEIVAPTYDTGVANDDGLLTLLNGDADAMWVYASQADSYLCANRPENEDVPYDCTIWDGLGTDFAYVQTGIYEYALGGTTLSISKLGSGVSNVLDPCIEAFLQTESYYNLCLDYDLVDICFVNDYFPAGSGAIASYRLPTNELSSSCNSGYCSCPDYAI